MPVPDEPEQRISTESGLQIFSPGWHGRGLLLKNPTEVLRADRLDDVGAVVKKAAALAKSGCFVAGLVAYESGRAFETALEMHEPEGPLAWFGAYESAFEFPNGTYCRDARFRVHNARFSLTPEAYSAAFAQIKEAIREGDVYQINLTAPLHFEFEGNPLALWTALMDRQPVPYGAYIDTGGEQVLSCSPELFFRREGDHVLTRPMKGTVRRGSSPAEDDALESWLAADDKSRAENVMIVDLLRNDLSRCCVPGSVRVPNLFTTERYSTVIQMTSEIEGRLRRGADTSDVFAALFPCGSVTGAPKIEAVRLIRRLEADPRRVYCGALGFMHEDRSIFNVAIRTATIRGRHGVLGIGSGIVSDSDVDAEYRECLLKARFLTGLADDGKQPHLIETMRAAEGRIALLEYHVDRLRASARELRYPFDEGEWRSRVFAAIDPAGDQKVRSLLGNDGAIEVHAEILQPDKSEWTAVLSKLRIDETDRYRRHKTTRRDAYDGEWARAVKAGFDEVVFLNRIGDVAEGSRTNVVIRIGNEWMTPPTASGALPGVYRRHLMETRSVQERTLDASDFEKADEVYLCNAVRGMVRTKIMLAPEKIREDVT